MTSVGVRLPEDLLEKLDRLSEEENVDRSTVIRRLLERGYADHRREEAAKEYREGTISISEAATRAGLTIWEMERYLVHEGFTSAYSIRDVDREVEALRSIREE